MMDQAPPAPPPVALSDDNPLRRLNRSLYVIAMTAFAVVVTGLFFQMGVIPGIIALFIAKHFLVAVLALGLRLPPPKY